MLDLLCTKYLRVNVTLLAIKGIDTKIKEKSNYAQSSTSVCSSNTGNSTKPKSTLASSFKKSLRVPILQKTEKATNDISAYATFSSTGILGVEEQNMLVALNVVDESTNKIKKVIRWEKECKIIHDVAIEDDHHRHHHRDTIDNDDKDGSEGDDNYNHNSNDKDGCESSASKSYGGAPTVSIPIVLMKDKSAQMPSMGMDENENNEDGKKMRNTKKKMINDNLSEEIINIDLGLISSMNKANSKMEKINLGRASFVISEEVCGSHAMSIPIRCYNNDINYYGRKNNNLSFISSLSSSQNSSKSILKKLKKNPVLSSSKNKVSFSNGSNAAMNSFRGDRSREFALSPNAVLQLFVDISYADKGNGEQSQLNQVDKCDENNEDAKPVMTPSEALLRSQKENKSTSDANIMNGTQTNKIEETRSNTNPVNVLSEKGAASKAGESSGLLSIEKSQNKNANSVKKKKRNIKQSYYDVVFEKLMFTIVESCEKALFSCSELLCHGPNYDHIAEDHDKETGDVETMTSTMRDDESRTFCTEDDTTFYSDKKRDDRSTIIGDNDDYDDFTFGTASYYDRSSKVSLDTYEGQTDDDDDDVESFKVTKTADSESNVADNDSTQDDAIVDQRGDTNVKETNLQARKNNNDDNIIGTRDDTSLDVSLVLNDIIEEEMKKDNNKNNKYHQQHMNKKYSNDADNDNNNSELLTDAENVKFVSTIDNANASLRNSTADNSSMW